MVMLVPFQSIPTVSMVVVLYMDRLMYVSFLVTTALFASVGATNSMVLVMFICDMFTRYWFPAKSVALIVML